MLALVYVTGCTPLVSAILSPIGGCTLSVFITAEIDCRKLYLEYTVILFAIEHSSAYTRTCGLSIYHKWPRQLS